jgi:hypothetical protein
MTPPVTVTPRLEHEFRTDMLIEQMPVLNAKRRSLPFYPRSGQTCFGNDSISIQCRVY